METEKRNKMLKTLYELYCDQYGLELTEFKVGRKNDEKKNTSDVSDLRPGA